MRALTVCSCGALLLKQGLWSVNARNAEQYNCKLWILELLSGVFEVNKILLNPRYIVLSCTRKRVAPNLNIQGS